jgi:hypothetical protein
MLRGNYVRANGTQPHYLYNNEPLLSVSGAGERAVVTVENSYDSYSHVRTFAALTGLALYGHKPGRTDTHLSQRVGMAGLSFVLSDTHSEKIPCLHIAGEAISHCSK